MTSRRSATRRVRRASAALGLRFGVRFELLEVGANRGAIDRVELGIGLARLARLTELHQRLAEVQQTVGRAFALRVIAVIGEQSLGSAPCVALVEQGPADEVVGVARAA